MCSCRCRLPAPLSPPGIKLQVLLIENDINTNPFTQAVHACVPPLPWSVSEADLVCWWWVVGGGRWGHVWLAYWAQPALLGA